MANLVVTLDAGNTAAQNTAFKQFAWDKMDEESRPVDVASVTEAQIEAVINSCIKSHITRAERNAAKASAATTF